MDNSPRSNYLGIALMASTWFIYAIMSATAKHTYQFAPPTVSFFFQNFVALVLTAPFLLKGGLKELKSSRPLLLFVRGVGGAAAFYAFFHSLAFLPLTDCTVLNNTAPLFVPLILLAIWKQKSPWQIWFALLLGFAGIAFVFPPQSGSVNFGTFLGLAAGLGTALTMFVIRALSEEPPARVMFYYFLIASVGTIPFAAAHIPSLPAASWPYYLATGVLFAIAQVAYTYSLRKACPSVSAPFSYSFVLGAAAIDWLLWGNLPSLLSAIGIAMVIGGGLIILFQLKAAQQEPT